MKRAGERPPAKAPLRPAHVIFQRIGLTPSPSSTRSPAQNPESKAQPRRYAHQRSPNPPGTRHDYGNGWLPTTRRCEPTGQPAMPASRPNGCSVSTGSHMPTASVGIPNRRYARYAWLSPCRMLTLRNRPPLPPSGLSRLSHHVGRVLRNDTSVRRRSPCAVSAILSFPDLIPERGTGRVVLGQVPTAQKVICPASILPERRRPSHSLQQAQSRPRPTARSMASERVAAPSLW